MVAIRRAGPELLRRRSQDRSQRRGVPLQLVGEADTATVRSTSIRAQAYGLGVDPPNVPAQDGRRRSSHLHPADASTMRIIPVLDIAGGIAVHAQAGDRTRYAPLESGLAPGRVGDPVAVLRAFHDSLSIHECYVADLDAVQGGAVQRTLIRELAEFHTGFAGALLVDAGTHLPEGALEVLSCGASEVVVGLETLHAFSDLESIISIVGPTRV